MSFKKKPYAKKISRFKESDLLSGCPMGPSGREPKRAG
jgi:hypothetical protein